MIGLWPIKKMALTLGFACAEQTFCSIQWYGTHLMWEALVSLSMCRC